MKIKLTALAVLLGFSALLGACQDGASESPSPEASPEAAPEASPEAAPAE